MCTCIYYYYFVSSLLFTHLHVHTHTQVLVKKSYGDKKKRHRLRNWKLQQMDRDMEATNDEAYEADYTEFLEDLEEDKAYRSHVNIYHGERGLAVDVCTAGLVGRGREGARPPPPELNYTVLRPNQN